MKKLFICAVFFLACASVSHGQAASCNAWDIQNAVNAASEGQTITIPAGVCQATASVTCSTSSTNTANSCSGVNIQGKGVALVGAGNSRIIAWTAMASPVTTGTGSKLFTGMSGTKVTCAGGPPCTGTSLILTTPTITVGQTLTIMELHFSYGVIANTMTGTVTCWNASSGSCTAGQLLMNITSTTGTSGTTTTGALAIGSAVSIPVVSSAGFQAGTLIHLSSGTSCVLNSPGNFTTVTSVPDGTHLVADLNCNYVSGVAVVFGVRNQVVSNSKRWIVWNGPSVANRTIISSCAPHTSTVPMFNISEDTGFHTTISNLDLAPCTAGIPSGAAEQQRVIMNYTTNGLPIILHDLFMGFDATYPQNANGDSTMIEGSAARGLIYNVSAVMSPFQNAGPAFENVKDTTGVNGSWTTASTWGSADTTGTHARYVESSDFHALGTSTDVDDNAKQVARYNLYNNSAISTHGADTSSWGQRYFELYDSIFVYQGYSDGTTPNYSNGVWIFLRGGTFVAHDNVFPTISSGDFGTGADGQFIAMNLQRNQGPNPCWATGFGAANTGGLAYPLPRQCGYGNKTGTLSTARTPVSIVMFKNPSGANCDYHDNCDTSGMFCVFATVCSVHTGVPTAPFAMDFSIGGYASAPAATILDATGTGGVVTSTLTGGVVTSYTVAGGTGYTGANFDSTTYIGDLEPVYMWNMVRTIGGATATENVRVSDYCNTIVGGICQTTGSNNCTGLHVDVSANYIQAGREYFTNANAPNNVKPGYTPFTYPHPLALGSGPSISFNPTLLTFGNQNVGTSSASQTIQLSNPGTANLTITGISITGTNPGDYSQTNTCPGTVVPTGSCNISVTFTPTTTGSRTANVTVVDNAPGSPQSVPLSGTGISAPAVSFNPTTLNFGNQTPNTTSSPLSIVVTNVGNANLILAASNAVVISGAQTSFFAITANTCTNGLTIVPTGTCSITLTFTPTTSGVATAQINLTDNAPGSPQVAPLTGTGNQAAPAATMFAWIKTSNHTGCPVNSGSGICFASDGTWICEGQNIPCVKMNPVTSINGKNGAVQLTIQ